MIRIIRGIHARQWYNVLDMRPRRPETAARWARAIRPLFTKSEAMMEVRLTQEMLTAVKKTPELPDNLRTRVIDAKAAGDLFVLKLD